MTSSETPGYTFKPAIMLVICSAFLVSFSFNSLQGLYFSMAANAIGRNRRDVVVGGKHTEVSK